MSVLPDKRNAFQRTIIIKINVGLAYSLNEKKSCLFALKCAKVEDNNIQK